MTAAIGGFSMRDAVWFITGCSTGFGRALATYIADLGRRAVVTARSMSDIVEFQARVNCLTLELDVTDAAQVRGAVAAAEKHFGHINVLVNNAGVGYFAAVEEGDDVQVREMFDVNVFGLACMIRAALPGMRKRRSGVIANFSSVGGLVSSPALGYYNATKFAVEGLSRALRCEVEPLGIDVILIEPSGFRTDWAGRSAKESAIEISDYAATAGQARSSFRRMSGMQSGDPIRAVKAIVGAIEGSKPPHHLLLGNFAFDAAMASLEDLRCQFAKGEAVARGADYP